MTGSSATKPTINGATADGRFDIDCGRGTKNPMTVENLPSLFAAYPLLLSGIALIWLLRSRQDWAMRALASGSVVAFAFLTGPWAFTSYYLRYVALGLFAIAAGVSYRRAKRGRSAAASHREVPVVSALVLLAFAVLDLLAIASRYPSEDAIDLYFPLAAGTYYVLQGGASAVTNPFHALSGDKHALDIVKLNRFGNRADGVAPRYLSSYSIFGEELHSPCDGTVLSGRDHLPDNPPGRPDADRPEGNYVVLKCGQAEVFMGHLLRGSVRPARGEPVTAGQVIARIGNSGNTLEPHLHIAARQYGMEKALTFNSRSLSVNSVVTSVRGRAVP